MAKPAYSPDLNPIENLWDALGRAVSLHFPPPTTLIELETDLQEEWRLLNSAGVDHLNESMFAVELEAFFASSSNGTDKSPTNGTGLLVPRLTF
ncbi:transposable element Tcb1 transposase [Trichonephila clavipes]|uniref:Transposable element Tcb1 transposase n=1 Tax=Trichonephila clavipes TaxID=2585209 RepID=A0A8X6RVQ3_TRICX|nr:transposable element Tcb1 transposase [Trichonephila clavipes]